MTGSDARWVDLHLHTIFSDGADTPKAVAARAASLGASAMAITDHDTLGALPRAAAACAEHGIEFLPGVEISSHIGTQELHILGLGVDTQNPALRDRLEKMAAVRLERGRAMAARLNALGVPVDFAAIEARAGGVVGRMHLAKAVVELGHAATVQDAFEKYLKAGRPAYVARESMSAREAVDAIHAADGLAFVAHPGIGRIDSRFDVLLEIPFDGIEAFHSKHTADQQKRYAALAEKRGLLITGGSDCHGGIKGDPLLIGTVRTPYEVYARIRDRLTGSGSSAQS